MVVRDFCLLCKEKLTPFESTLSPWLNSMGLQTHPAREDCLVTVTDAFGVPIDLGEIEQPTEDPEPFFQQTHPLLEKVLMGVFDSFKLPRLGGASTGRGWTNFSVFQRCPYAWKRKYVDNVAPFIIADIPGLSIGTLVHTFLALHYANMMPDSLYKALTPEIMFERLRAQANPELVGEGWRLFKAYRLYYQFEELNRTFTPLAIEYDLRNPRTNESTRYDLVAFVEHERPGLLPGTYIVEHKTAQRFDSDTLEGWANDGEILGEVALWKLLGLDNRFGPLKGVIVNIIGKQKEPKFHRTVVAPSSWQVGQHLEDLKRWEGMIGLAQSTGVFPRARAGCLTKYGRCSEWDHCLTNE